MSEDYWDGALWVYHADIVNDGSNSGNHIYLMTVGAGNELEVLYGSILNGDASNRVAFVRIDDGAELIAPLLGDLEGITLNSGQSHGFPYAPAEASGGAAAGAGARYLMAGAMRLRAQVTAIAVSQDSAFGIACRIRGEIPTVVLTSPTDAVETVNTNRVF